MDLLLIGGVSGSGKSVALTALEDSGHYAVSNLPPPQLAGLLAHLKSAGTDRVAVVLDVKTGGGLADLPVAIDSARAEGWTVRFLYLDATTETLVKRFSETRRRHPFSGDERTLTEAIEFERALFADLRALGYSFALSGRDPAVVAYLERYPEVERMYTDIYHFVASWLPDYARDNRNYLTIAIGCTGGQHRSVYLAERLAQAFVGRYQVLARHRQLA